MSRIKKIVITGQEILSMDYRGCKEKELILAATELKEAILEGNKPVFVVALFDDKTYITPAFMRHAERETAEAIHLVEQSSFVGLSTTKKFILMGYNLLFNRDFKAFDTEEEAIHYMMSKKVPEKMTS